MNKKMKGQSIFLDACSSIVKNDEFNIILLDVWTAFALRHVNFSDECGSPLFRPKIIRLQFFYILLKNTYWDLGDDGSIRKCNFPMTPHVRLWVG